MGYSPWGLKEWDMTEHTTATACFLQRNRQTYKWRFRCKLSRLSLWIHFLLFLPDSTSFTFHFHALEKEMATYSSVLAWGIPGMAEPCGLLSMGSRRVGHD